MHGARSLAFTLDCPAELQWRIEDTAVDNLLSDYWGDVDMVQGTNRKLHYRYVVDMPRTRPLSWNKEQLPKWVSASTKAAAVG